MIHSQRSKIKYGMKTELIKKMKKLLFFVGIISAKDYQRSASARNYDSGDTKCGRNKNCSGQQSPNDGFHASSHAFSALFDKIK